MSPQSHRPPYARGYTAGPGDPFVPGDWSDIERDLQLARNYWVCSTRPDGRPHAMPVWGLWLQEAVWFSTSPQSVKARNFAHDPHCVIHLESGDDAVILEGVVHRVDPDEPAVAQFVSDYFGKYGIKVAVHDPDFALYRLPPTKAYTWKEQNFPTSNARWTFTTG